LILFQFRFDQFGHKSPAARLALSSFMYHVPRLTETYFDDISLSLFYHNIINERIITSHPVSLTYNVFTTTECSYLYKLTLFSSLETLVPPLLSPFLDHPHLF